MTDGDIIHQYKKDQIRKKTTSVAFSILCDQAAFVSLPSGKKNPTNPHKCMSAKWKWVHSQVESIDS